MNVVRELRNTITNLQAKLQKKQQQFTGQKKKYEELIKNLQEENQRLKSLLEGDSLISRSEGVFKEDGQNDGLSKVHEHDPEYWDLVNENSILKSQISEISDTYQKQIEEINFYFEKIKRQNKRLIPMQAHYIGQLNYLKNQYYTLMTDSEKQRKKYQTKLLQCAQILQSYENTKQSQQQELQKKKIKIKQLQQQIRIEKRIKY